MLTLANQIDRGQSRLTRKARAFADVALALALTISAALSLYALEGRMILASVTLASLMLAIARVDFSHFRIPDVLCLPSIPLGLLASGFLVQSSVPSIVDSQHAIGALIGGAALWAVRITYWRLRHRHGLGLGDVKLAAAAGAWLGIDLLPNVLLLACSLAIVGLMVAHIVFGHVAKTTSAIPFGTALAPAIWIIWFCSIGYTSG